MNGLKEFYIDFKIDAGYSAEMLDCKERFLTYLDIEKNFSIHTQAAYLRDLKFFFLFCLKEEIDFFNIDPVDIRSYFAYLINEQGQLEKKTQSRKLSSLRTFYKFIHRENLIQNNPVLSVKFPKVRSSLPKNFTPIEMEDILEFEKPSPLLEKRDRAILEVLYSSGIRVFELVNAKISELSGDYSTLKVMGKRRKERYVFLGDAARETLESYLGSRNAKDREDYIFLNQKGKKLTTRGVRYILNVRRKLMGFDKTVTPHKFRHTFATDLLDAGADIRAVQELLGHASLSSTQVYLSVSKDRLKEVYRKAHPHAKM